MNRRKFVKNASFAALFPFVLNALSACHVKTTKQKRILVLIQLVGGNDGLNTLIPLDNYKRLVYARPNLYIPESKILSLKGTSQVGLHPNLAGFKDMYENGFMGFIQGVGYENPSYSHFRSSDIWLTGSKSSEVLYTGWMARFLETHFKKYPEGFPSKQQPDPPAIKIGDTGTYLFQGTKMDMSIVIDPHTTFEPISIDSWANESTGFAGEQIKSIREILLQTERYSKVIKNALSVNMQHSKLYPNSGENALADQLKVVAKLINGGLETSVYLVDLNGFDTHDGQADKSDSTKGVHADLLTKLSQAITCFWDDMNFIGREKDVMGMTFSEFGRRIMSNAGNGTDHGSSQPIVYFGSSIKSEIIGANPDIPENATVYDNLSLQFDYRAVFSSVLKNWLGASDLIINSVFPDNFPEIRLIK